MPPPNQVLELIERFEHYLDEYKRSDYKEARVRAEFIDPFLEALGWGARNVRGRVEHEDMPDNQDRVAAGVGGMVGLRREVARWGWRGMIGVWGVVFDELAGGQASIYSVGLRRGLKPNSPGGELCVS